MSFARELVDYHVHSNYSCDGKSTILEMCQKAVELGIVEIGFSEHMDFEPKDSGFGFFNYERYSHEIKSAQKLFRYRLAIRKGVEIDYQHCFEDDIRVWLENKSFDFIIGSVHYVEHEYVDHRLVARKDLKEVYQAYFDEVARSIESGLFNVVGHFDLIRQYVANSSSELRGFDYWERVKSILEGISGGKMYLEVNLKGWREGSKSMIPCSELVRFFIESGGKLISVGSDAHSTGEIGPGIRETLDFLADCNGNRVKLLFES